MPVDFEELRQFMLSLPGVTEQPHFERISFRVRGRIFATAPLDGVSVNILLEEEEARAVIAAYPAFGAVFWGTRLRGVRVALPADDADVVCDLLRDAWRLKSPRRHILDHDAGG